jgi:histidyl-tRNA synthetase
MTKSVQAVRGMNDILPEQTPYWQAVEDRLRRLLSAYGYQEIRLPAIEKTELFVRSIGEATDIVEKEMYSFFDRNGESLTLRPEGTAGCVRAGIEHSLFYKQPVQRLWYQGPMFRHERPQKGRYRQFHQIGVEAFGLPGPDIDAEIILMTGRLWRQLGLTGLRLQLNSLGSAEARQVYRETLVAYLSQHLEALDEDSRRRLTTNPLRVLDSKNPQMQGLIEAAPRLLDHLDDESRAHFAGLRAWLDQAEIPYEINPRLVRGLDYYTKTVFEWVSDRLGAQGTVCAGGRYDGLVQQIGGSPTPAIGFAIGLERLIALLGTVPGFAPEHHQPHAYLVTVGEAAERYGLLLAEELREKLPRLRLLVNCSGGGFKGQLKRADKSSASLALILGDDEMRQDTISIKHLREERPQQTLARADVPSYLQRLLAESGVIVTR